MKNSQPIPNSTQIGIDLNRNWSYMWNCCGGSSGNPGSARYRGDSPFQGKNRHSDRCLNSHPKSIFAEDFRKSLPVFLYVIARA